MVAIKEVMEKDDVVIVTNARDDHPPACVRIRVAGRNTQGVRLIRLDEKDKIAAIAIVPSEEDDAIESAAAKVESEPKAKQATLFEPQEEEDVKPAKKESPKKETPKKEAKGKKEKPKSKK